MRRPRKEREQTPHERAGCRRRRAAPSTTRTLSQGAGMKRFDGSHSDNESSLLEVAVVGLGYWGPNLLRGLIELPDVNVRYICDLDAERLSAFSRRYPGATPTDRYEDLLTDPQLDAIVIATPVFTHFELAAAALGANKHTFVE